MTGDSPTPPIEPLRTAVGAATTPADTRSRQAVRLWDGLRTCNSTRESIEHSAALYRLYQEAEEACSAATAEAERCRAVVGTLRAEAVMWQAGYGEDVANGWRPNTKIQQAHALLSRLLSAASAPPETEGQS